MKVIEQARSGEETRPPSGSITCGTEMWLEPLRATRHHRQIAVIAMSGQFGPELVGQEGVVCFSKPSTLNEFLRLGAIVSGLLQQKSFAEAHSSEGVQ